MKHVRRQTKRLLKAAALLEANAKNRKGTKFDIGLLGSVYDFKAPVSCGTTACAMGHFALTNAFKRAGLEAKIITLRNHFSNETFGKVQIKWRGKLDSYVEAGAALFGITPDVSHWLFGLDDYPPSHSTGAKGERAVASRLRFIAKGGDPARYRGPSQGRWMGEC